jgi:gliding motility-associated-like protein
MRGIAFMIIIFLFADRSHAQPANTSCASAALACAHQTYGGNTTAGGSGIGFCPLTSNLRWYTFTTNSVGGVVDVELSNLACLQVPGMADSISVVVLGGNPNCLGPFAPVSNCTLLGSDAVIFTDALQPSTTYWIIVAGGLGDGTQLPAECGFELSVGGPGADVVGVDFSAGTDVTIGLGESTQLLASGGPPYDWSPTSGLSGNGIPNPIASPQATTTYTVTTTIGACTYSDDVEVRIFRRIDPPNTFTPNGDGFNDTWAIPGIADYPGAEVNIYDRWGQRVYTSNGYREPWDGTRNGNAVSVGTYYYHIQLNQLEGKSPPYTGFISIVR